MYRRYKSNKYEFAKDYSQNSEYVNNILSSKYNQKVFSDNKKLFYLYFLFFILLDIIFLILLAVFCIYYESNAKQLSIHLTYLLSASFINLGIWWVGRFAVGISGWNASPYSILTLMYWSFGWTFNLSWYYIYYLSIVYKKFNKEETRSIIEDVYHLKKHCTQKGYYVAYDVPSIFIGNPFESIISCARIRYTKKNVEDEKIDLDNLVSKYSREQIIKDMKRPYFMCHAYNIVNFITTIIIFSVMLWQLLKKS